MPVREIRCNTDDSYGNGYVFLRGKKEVARCDESDYHETVDDLRQKGYIIIS